MKQGQTSVVERRTEECVMNLESTTLSYHV